jgi:hypothetical protein
VRWWLAGNLELEAGWRKVRECARAVRACGHYRRHGSSAPGANGLPKLGTRRLAEHARKLRATRAAATCQAGRSMGDADVPLNALLKLAGRGLFFLPSPQFLSNLVLFLFVPMLGNHSRINA